MAGHFCMRAVRTSHLGTGLGRHIFQLSSQFALEKGVQKELRSIVGRKLGPCLYSERLLTESLHNSFVVTGKKDFAELYPARQQFAKEPLIVTFLERTQIQTTL